MKHHLLCAVALVTMTFALQNVVIAAEVGAKEKETSVTKDTRIVEGAFRRVKQACASIKIGKTLQIVKQSGWATFNDVLDTFAVASDGSDFILSGTVVSDNTGMGVPFVPIFVGSSLHLPMLVALTIADGEVRFRVQISVKRDEKPQPIASNEIWATLNLWDAAIVRTSD